MKPEGGVALLALKCLFGFKLPYLMAYKESLERLAGDKTCVAAAAEHNHTFVCYGINVLSRSLAVEFCRYREEMGKFAVGTGASVILLEHRTGVLSVITRLLYGRLLQRKGNSGKDTPQQRRAAFLSFLAGYVNCVLYVVHAVPLGR
jgi:hypothetical protein